MLTRRNLLLSTGTVLPYTALGALGASGLTPENADPKPAHMKTFSSIGKGTATLDGKHEATLLEHSGSGCLNHMWFGGEWQGYGQTRIRVYVDGERLPPSTWSWRLGTEMASATPDPGAG
jgi:hypothetical protein